MALKKEILSARFKASAKVGPGFPSNQIVAAFHLRNAERHLKEPNRQMDDFMFAASVMRIVAGVLKPKG